MRMQKKQWKALLMLGLAASVSLSPACPLEVTAWAGVSGGLTEYGEEELERYRDDTLEYEEIPGLIELYNSAFLNQLDSLNKNPGSSTGLSRDQLLSMASDLREEAQRLSREADEQKDDLTKEEYQEYQDNIRELKLYAANLEKDAEGTPSGWRTLKELQKTQTRSACGMMREYQKLSSQSEIRGKELEAARMEYETALRKQELNLYSGEDVLAAREALNAAEAADSEAKKEEAARKQELLTTLGWNYDADPEIRKVPEADPARASGYQPETDSETAILNNYTLMEKRRTGASGFGGQNEKNRQLKELEDSVRASMDQLYQQVLQKESALKAASTEFEAASAAMAAADQKNRMGMLSRQEYINQEIAYLTARASKEAADLDLTAAMEDYEWAIQGLLSIGGES